MDRNHRWRIKSQLSNGGKFIQIDEKEKASLETITKNIRYLFLMINQELENISQWFVSNKFSLIYMYKKTKYSFFHKPSQKNTENKQLRNKTNRIISVFWSFIELKRSWKNALNTTKKNSYKFRIAV